MASALPFRLLTLAALLALAACGPLPRPFQPEDKRLDLRAVAARAAILVVPPAGAASDHADKVAEAMERALEREGLLVTRRPTEGHGRRLESRAQLVPLPGDGEELVVAWQVVDESGWLWARHESRLQLAAGSWAEGGGELVEVLSAEAAPVLASALFGPKIEEALIPGFPGARLVVLPVEGEPNGGSQLADGLKRELSERGLPLAGLPGERDLLLAGRVELAPPVADWQQVTITWRLARADGKALGEVAQANRVPVGSLHYGWEASVPVIAEGAAEGTLTLLRQAGGG